MALPFKTTDSVPPDARRIAYPGSFDPVNIAHIHMLAKMADTTDGTIRVIVLHRPKQKSVPRLLELDNAASLFALALPDPLAPRVEVATSNSIKTLFRSLARDVTHVVRGVRERDGQKLREQIVAGTLTAASVIGAHHAFRVVLLRQDAPYDAISSRLIRRAINRGGTVLKQARPLMPEVVADVLAETRRHIRPTRSPQALADFNVALRETIATMPPTAASLLVLNR